MEGLHRYPVFIECAELDEAKTKKIENYFSIRRKSGGGDCGSLRKVKHQVYTIAFQDEEASRRVLQRSQHEVECSDGPLLLRVRASPEDPCSSPTNSKSTDRGQTQTESQFSDVVPSASPSGDECELHLDMYLILYLREDSQAKRALREELSSLIYSAHFYPEEEKVLVRRLAPTKPGGADREGGPAWRQKVRQIFDNVKEHCTCHFEFEPHKVRALLRRCSSDHAVDQVKVYSEGDVAIVVGEPSQVQAALREVEDVCDRSQRPERVETETKSHWPGETELWLPWGEVEDRLGDEDLSVTESSLEEVQELVSQSSAASAYTARGAAASAGRSCYKVQIEIVEGLIERQQVGAVVCPMVDCDLSSTSVGNALMAVVGPRLRTEFHRKEGACMFLGDSVLLEDLPKLLAEAVFFLNLHPWDGNEDGASVQILQEGFTRVLATCDRKGIDSIAVPVIGTGAVLRFPSSLAARVLLEEVHKFEASRLGEMPLLVRFVTHPNDGESRKEFQSALTALSNRGAVPAQGILSSRRIVVLGKTGVGKSSLCNTIFGEDLFTASDSPNAETSQCRAETRVVHGRSVTLIDTPGLFDPERSDKDLKCELIRCITECSPGPHAFLLVLRVDRFTQQEEDIISKITEVFSEDALKFTTIVFTHGNQLSKGMQIKEFVQMNKGLRDLVRKCGGRCHVIDNTHWTASPENNDRSNLFQVEALLETIDEMMRRNNGRCYTNEMLQVVNGQIQVEEAKIRERYGHMSSKEVTHQAKVSVSRRLCVTLAGVATGAVLGAFLGVAGLMLLAVKVVREHRGTVMSVLAGMPTTARCAAAAAGLASAATAGAVVGGITGYEVADRAETPGEAAAMAAKAVSDKANVLRRRLSKDESACGVDGIATNGDRRRQNYHDSYSQSLWK